MRRIVLVALLLSTLPLPPTAADPGGGDAPCCARWARPLDPGDHTGTFLPGHDEDYYRIANPEKTYVRVTLTMHAPGPVTLYLHTHDQEYFGGEATVLPHQGTPRVAVLESQNAGGSLLLKLHGYMSVESEYGLRVELVPAPDFAPLRLHVENRGADTAAGLVPTGLRRQVTLDVGNLGATAATGEATLHVRTRTDGTTTLLGKFPLALDGHAEQRIVVDWDVANTGTLGDADLIATLWTRFDGDRANDAASVRHYTVVGATGYGATAGTTTTWCDGDWARTCVHVHARPQTVWVQQEVSTIVGRQGAAGGFLGDHAAGYVYLTSIVWWALVEGAYGTGGGYVKACPDLGRCVETSLP